jgi:anaerobic glycerol-3-phosphate dehydrogenase
VLGLDPRLRTRERLVEQLGVEIGEALGTPPSVPGWRLDAALLRALEQGGVTVAAGRVTGSSARGTTLEAVDVLLSSGASARYAAARFVLATGRFTGGGIRASDVIEEVDVARGQALREAGLVEGALGCDVWVDHLGARFAQVQPVPLTDPARSEPQALLRAGVHVDSAGRPLDRQDRAHYLNVSARGAVVADVPHGLGYAAAGPRA